MNGESNRTNNIYFTNDCCSDDLFLCGKCKCQFKDIKIFMDHKTNFCLTNTINNQMKLPSMNSREHNYQTNDFYTEDINNEHIGGYAASNSIYNDGNTPKNNINGSYVDDGKYQPMEFHNELGGDCNSFNNVESFKDELLDDNTAILNTIGTENLPILSDKKVFKVSSLKHLRRHIGVKVFQCPICGRKFSQKSNAKKHIFSHKVGKNNDDSSLLKFYNKAIQLKEKRNLIISVNNSSECSFCKQNFYSFQTLRTHKDLQVYLCVYADCKQTFEDLDPFLHHFTTHKKDKNNKFNCQFCGTLFKSLYEVMCIYKEDMASRGHTNSKCQKCHKQTEDTQIKVADNVIEYFVSYFKNDFPSKKPIKSHVNKFELRQHFNCPICSKDFSTEIYLSRHLRIVHKSSMILFRCKQCDRIFRTMSSLRYHEHRLLPHPDCKLNHCDPKKNCSANLPCRCFFNTNKQLKKRKVKATNIPITSPLDSQADAALKHNFDEERMVCFYCEKLFRRRLPFESHVPMCKQQGTSNFRECSSSVIKSSTSAIGIPRKTKIKSSTFLRATDIHHGQDILGDIDDIRLEFSTSPFRSLIDEETEVTDFAESASDSDTSNLEMTIYKTNKRLMITMKIPKSDLSK